MNKLEFNLDSTGLSNASCLYKFHKVCIEGYRQPVMNAAAVYGIAAHAFIKTMFKTDGNYPIARKEAERVFSLPKALSKSQAKTKSWLIDPKHFHTTCYNLWNERVLTDNSFERVVLPSECWWCKGSGHVINDVKFANGTEASVVDNTVCPHCQGKKLVNGPAVEISFRILFYEDDYIKVYLCGTIDEIVKFVGGIYAIGDWKFTTFWDSEDYLSGYEMSRQLRIYTLAIKKMVELAPDSPLAKIGLTNVGAFIDGVFVKSKPNDNEYKRSEVMTFRKEDMELFEDMLLNFCLQVSRSVAGGLFRREGILNGTCQGKYGSKCDFWHVCKNNKQVGDLLLNREFKRVPYNPMAFNEEEE